jgi:hypothetical protein
MSQTTMTSCSPQDANMPLLPNLPAAALVARLAQTVTVRMPQTCTQRGLPGGLSLIPDTVSSAHSGVAQEADPCRPN